VNNGNPQKILIIDDNQENRYTVSRYLKRAGFDTIEAPTGYEGLRLVNENPSLVLLDIKLPDIVGWEVCRRIKADPRSSSIPVLFTSATFIRTRDRVHGLEEGADGYLTVPIEPEELVATVRALLRMREAESAAHSLANQWRATFDAISDGVCLLDTETRVERCNKRFAALVERKVAEVGGLHLAQVSTRLREGAEVVRAALSSGERRVREIHTEGRWIRFTVDPVRRFDGTIDGAVCIISDIDERKRVEQELEHQHRITRGITENAASCLFLVDQENRPTYMNPAAERITGYRIEDLQGRTLHECFHPHKPAAKCPLLKAFKRNTPVRDHEDVFVRKDGTLFPVVCSLTPITVDGVVKEAVLEFRDVTEEKRAQRSILENEERFRMVNRATNDVIWDWDVQTDSLRWNDAIFTAFGYTQEEIGSRLSAWQERIHPDDRAQVERSFFEVLNGSADGWSDEYRFQRRDGSYAVILDRGIVARDASGKAYRMIGSMLDLSSYRKIEAELRQTQERYRFLAETMPQLVWTTSADGQTDYLNQRWKEFSGQPLETLLGRGWVDLVHPDDREKTVQTWRACVQLGKPYMIEYRLRRRDGEYRWTLSRGVPLRDAAGNVTKWFGTSTDVHDQKVTQQALQQAKEQLTLYAAGLEQQVSERTSELQNTVQELEAFCYTIAHDLRAPLRAMEGFTRALVEDYQEDLDDVGREYARRTNEAARRMDHLIKDLLEYARLSRVDIDLEPVDLDLMVRGLLQQRQHEIESRDATVTVEGILPRVMAHPVLVDQILGNIFGNALKFVAEGRPPRISFRCEESGALQRLWVEDNGIGISRQYHDRIFKIFERLHVDKSFAGTGIGLAIVRRAVERCGGRFGLESELGKGSRFWVEFRMEPSQVPA
jgi:PAS domain S-box-containing protein